ncbi:MAG: imidazoleglycerol-phosphate dehydratase HisB [Candidatus Aminicenantes bacterium]
MSRRASYERRTKETEISASVNLDGKGIHDIDTPVGFLTHMLETFAIHGLFDIRLKARGDFHVDQHHLIEDCGLVLGRAFHKALGDRKGINRAGYFVYPMDEALAVVAVDMGGRPYLQYDVTFRRRFCGRMDTDLLEDFFQAFSVSLKANIAVRMPYGRSDHHKMEAIFKAFGKAFRMACSKNPIEIQNIPSTKGVIDHDRDR